jgi:hypothetical protein
VDGGGDAGAAGAGGEGGGGGGGSGGGAGDAPTAIIAGGDGGGGADGAGTSGLKVGVIAARVPARPGGGAAIGEVGDSSGALSCPSRPDRRIP